jgi:hypothetical protein
MFLFYIVHGGIAKRRGESSAQKEEDQPNDQSIEAELMRIVDGMDKEMTSHDLQIKNFQQLLHKVIGNEMKGTLGGSNSRGD